MLGQGLNLHPRVPETQQILLCHSGIWLFNFNSSVLIHNMSGSHAQQSNWNIRVFFCQVPSYYVFGFFCLVGWFFFFFCFFLELHLWHMEVPRLEVESELYPLVYATATAMLVASQVCSLHCCSWQRQILNTLSKGRDWTHILMDTSWIRYCWATTGTPPL